MSSKITSVSSQTSSPLAAASDVKSDGRTRDDMIGALARGTIEILSGPVIPGQTAAESSLVMQNVMNLAPLDWKLISHGKLPEITLKLTPQERALLDEIFGSLALQQEMCLLEILGVDLFKQMGALIPLLPAGAGEMFREKFCGDFFWGYISLIMIKNATNPDSNFPEVTLYDRTKPSNGFEIGISIGHWVLLLTQVIEALKSSRISKSARTQAVIKRVDLLIALISKPKSHTFLVDDHLVSLEKYFPKSAALTHASTEKTHQDLTTLTEFLITGFNSGLKRGYFSIQDSCMSEFHEALETFSKKRKLADVKNIKQKLGNALIQFEKLQRQTQRSLSLAKAGTLSHKSYCASQGISVAREKNQKEFTAFLYAQLLQCSLITDFYHDCLEIFDKQILVKLFPDVYVPTSAALHRLDANLVWLLNKAEARASSPLRDLSIPSSSLIDMQKAELGAFHTHVQSSMRTLLSPFLPAGEQLNRVKSGLDNLHQADKLQYHRWIPFVQLFESHLKLFDLALPSLEELRLSHLEKIESFLKTLDPRELSQNRQKWIDYFEEISFQENLDFCRLCMLTRDLQAVSYLNVNINGLNSEDHLLPEELIDLMSLEGLEEIFERLAPKPLDDEKKPSTAVRPMIEDIEGKPEKPRPTTVQATTAVVARSLAQTLSLTATPAPRARAARVEEEVPFKIRRGEKKRKIIARLRELGFLPRSIRGSHLKLESKDDGKQTILPLHGSLKTGTAHSIEKQVNKHRKGKR